MRPTGVRWLSFSPGSGFGNAAEDYMTGLRRASVPLTWTPLGWPSYLWRTPLGPRPEAVGGPDNPHRDVANVTLAHDTVVVHSSPLWHERLETEAEGRRILAFATWETDRLPAEYVPTLNRYHAVMVPSRFNAQVFAASGIGIPIHVVPHVVNRVRARSRPAVRPGSYVFYMVSTWTSRKAVLDAVRAFLLAFGASDPVRLVIHTTKEDLVATARSGRPVPSWMSLARALAGRADPPEIVLSTAALDRKAVAAFHRRGDCFVSLSRGEGWGLGATEAAAVGNPVVVTGWGGTPEVLPEGYPYLVDFELVPTTEDPPDLWWSPQPGERWARADVAAAAALLRHVFEHREEAAEWGLRLRAHVRGTYGPETVRDVLLRVILSVPLPTAGRTMVSRGDGQE